MAVDAVWSVLVWKAQQGSGWDVLVHGPTRAASAQIDEVALTDERIVATVLSLLPATAAAAPLRRAPASSDALPHAPRGAGIWTLPRRHPPSAIARRGDSTSPVTEPVV